MQISLRFICMEIWFHVKMRAHHRTHQGGTAVRQISLQRHCHLQSTSEIVCFRIMSHSDFNDSFLLLYTLFALIQPTKALIPSWKMQPKAKWFYLFVCSCNMSFRWKQFKFLIFLLFVSLLTLQHFMLFLFLASHCLTSSTFYLYF